MQSRSPRSGSFFVALTMLCAVALAPDAMGAPPKTSKKAPVESTKAEKTAAKAVKTVATKTSGGCAEAVRFTSDAILLLATVLDGKIERGIDPCETSGGEFFADGVRWIALDRFGQQVGVVVQKTDDKFGMHFAKESGSFGAKLFMRGPKSTSFVSYEHTATAAERKELLAALELKKAKDVTFFEAGGERIAVVTTAHALTVVRKAGKKGWLRVHRDLDANATFPVYTLRAVLDVDGDGFPEIVEHVAEREDGAGYEVVLRRNGKGEWPLVASNEDKGP